MREEFSEEKIGGTPGGTSADILRKIACTVSEGISLHKKTLRFRKKFTK